MCGEGGCMKHSCPKCGGYLYRGGLRFGWSAADMVTCVNCGLSNESHSFYDAVGGVYRDMVAPHGVVSRVIERWTQQVE